jgi:hypothetical protein
MLQGFRAWERSQSKRLHRSDCHCCAFNRPACPIAASAPYRPGTGCTSSCPPRCVSCHRPASRVSAHAGSVIVPASNVPADQDSVRLLAVECCGPLAQLCRKDDVMTHILPVVQKFSQVRCSDPCNCSRTSALQAAARHTLPCAYADITTLSGIAHICLPHACAGQKLAGEVQRRTAADDIMRGAGP